MITGAQVRAARALLKIKATDLVSLSGVSIATVARIEGQDGVPTARADILADIQRALEAAGIEFIGTTGVKLATSSDRQPA